MLKYYVRWHLQDKWCTCWTNGKNKGDPEKSFFGFQIEIILKLFFMTSKRMIQKSEQIIKKIICTEEQKKMKCWNWLFRVSIEIGSALMLMTSNRLWKKSKLISKSEICSIDSKCRWKPENAVLYPCWDWFSIESDDVKAFSKEEQNY